MDDRARHLSTLLVLAWSMAGTLEAQVPYLVRDIDATPVGSQPFDYVALDDVTVLFAARDGAHGRELWRSDGTEAGTFLVRDLWPGPASSDPRLGAVVGGILFFSAEDRDHGRELWRSDGTEAGTFLVRDIGPGSEGSDPAHLTAGEGLVYFQAETPDHGIELWASDGTIDGTGLVLDIVPGPLSSFASPRLAHGGRLYFTAFATDRGNELWTSDGTAAGTAILRDIAPGVASAGIGELTPLGERVCFDALRDLWCTDGTGAGTVRVHPLDDGAVTGLAAVGDRLLVRTPDSKQLWISDGTSAGTAPIRDDLVEIRSLTSVGDRAFFSASEGSFGLELWTSDGTPAGTRLVRDIRPGPLASFPERFRAFGNRLVMVADDGVHGPEVWISDGSEEGTVLLADSIPGVFGGIAELRTGASRIWFSFEHDSFGSEPWTSDGTAAGTALLARLAPELTGGSSPRSFLPLGEGWLFTASDGIYGIELWTTDGTAAGTHPVGDPASGRLFNLSFSDAAVLGGRAYFGAADGVHGVELWTTDGTRAGTRLVRDIDPNGDGRPHELVVAGDRLFFFALRDQELTLWISDGTEEGTVQAAAGIDGQLGTCTLTPFGDGVAFIVDDPTIGGLWHSDGTTDGTLRISPLPLSCPDPELGNTLRVIDGTLYFEVFPREGQPAGLWRSDGTAAGTVPVVQIPDLGIIGPAVPVGGRIAFVGQDPIHGREPWVTDGTAAGTQLLVDARPDELDSSPLFLASLGARTVFAAGTPARGRELWRTDGTPEGTELLADLMPGGSSSRPRPGAADGARFFFPAEGPGVGRELWVTDGRPSGTRLIADLAPGPADALGFFPQLAHGGRKLLFRAGDGVHGEELWALDTLCFFGGRPLYLHDGRFRVDACWRRPDGRVGVGTGVSLTDEAGAFSFFNPDNLDLGLKVIDGRRVNGKYWFFFASLTDVAGKVRVTDTENGRYRDFELLPGRAHSFAAVDGFPEEQPVSAPLPPLAGPPPPGPIDGGCDDGSDELCVQEGRFRVRVAWETERGAGVGHAARTGANSGTFWFFRSDNVELMVKVHDGRPRNGHFWVFFGALSNVRYTVTVTDISTGAERVYESPQGRYTSVADTRAFAD